MSNGRNAEFTRHKGAFLAAHPMTVGFLQNRMPAASGIFEFDIQERAMGPHRVLEVIGFEHRAKAVTWKSNRISAYWLPWASMRTVQLDIGDAADYFFTSELNGCQFRIARTGANSLRAIHVAGDSHATSIAGTGWRHAQAQAPFTPAQFLASRAMTSTALLGAAAAHGRTGYGTADLWTNVFGFRRWHICGPATWEVWYQTVTRAPVTAAVPSPPYIVAGQGQIF